MLILTGKIQEITGTLVNEGPEIRIANFSQFLSFRTSQTISQLVLFLF